MIEKSRICFIQPEHRGGDYRCDAFRQMGYNVLVPYVGNKLFFRCLREVWFKCRFPLQRLWYNKKIMKTSAQLYIIADALLTTDFLRWLRQQKPNARLVLKYNNRIGENFINPNEIDDKLAIEKWSYDTDDCNKYHMKYIGPYYFDVYKLETKDNPVYDIVYVGKDKGRAEYLFEIERNFNLCGLSTYFYICADRSFLKWKKSFYQSFMPYKKYLKLISRTKAILNIMPEGQTSITMREMECVFNGIKGITNNKGIKDFELYHPSRFFVLGEDDISKLRAFLVEPFMPIENKVLDKYRFENVIRKITNYEEQK